MTTGDQDPNALGQPSGYPPLPDAYGQPQPPQADVYGQPQGVGYPPPGYPVAPPPGYAPPPPPPGYGPVPGYPPPPPGYAPPPPGVYPPATQPYGAPGGYFPGTPPVGLGGPGHLGRRLGARLIDAVGVSIVSFLLSFMFDSDSRILAAGIFTGFLTFVYFVLFEVLQGRTPGKALLGLRVHGPAGAPKPTWKQSAIRNAFTLLPIVPFLGGLLSIIAIIVIAVTIENSPTKQGKHDEMAGGTQVVRS